MDVPGGDSVTTTFWGAVVVFVSAAIGAMVQWWRGKKDDAADVRDLLLKMNSELRDRIDRLQDRITTLEEELHQKTLQVHAHEINLVRIKRVVLDKHGIDIDEMLAAG